MLLADFLFIQWQWCILLVHSEGHRLDLKLAVRLGGVCHVLRSLDLLQLGDLICEVR